MRTALWALLGLIILVCGFAAGLYFGLASSKSASTAMRLLAISDASKAIGAARSSTSSLEYEEALWRLLALLQSEATSKGSVLEDSVIATDIALTYARLSDLAAEQGLEVKSQLLLKEAVEQCPRTKLKDCAADSILKVARSSLPTALE